MTEKTEVIRTCVHAGHCIRSVRQGQFLVSRLHATVYTAVVQLQALLWVAEILKCGSREAELHARSPLSLSEFMGNFCSKKSLQSKGCVRIFLPDSLAGVLQSKP